MKISKLKEKIITCGAVAAVVGLMYIFKLPCIFKAVLGIPCPGCGMTRAYISLLHLDFMQAFNFNIMFWSVPVLLLLYLFDGKLFKANWANIALESVIFGGFFLGWVLKLIAL